MAPTYGYIYGRAYTSPYLQPSYLQVSITSPGRPSNAMHRYSLVTNEFLYLQVPRSICISFYIMYIIMVRWRAFGGKKAMLAHRNTLPKKTNLF